MSLWCCSCSVSAGGRGQFSRVSRRGRRCYVNTPEPGEKAKNPMTYVEFWKGVRIQARSTVRLTALCTDCEGLCARPVLVCRDELAKITNVLDEKVSTFFLQPIVYNGERRQPFAFFISPQQ